MAEAAENLAVGPAHPLEALTADEVAEAGALAKAKLGDRAAFCSVALVEPPKAFVKSFRDGDPVPRKLRFLGYDYPEAAEDGGFDATVDLVSGEVAVSRIERGQAPIGFADVVAAVQITKADAGWQAAMRRRGIEDFELVQIDPWPAGGYQHPSIPAGHRAHRAISFVRESKTDNGYARPVQGLIAHVDIDAGRVAHLEDHGDVPLPPEHGRYDAASQPRLREAPKPLEITQPEGVSFSVDGNAIAWQGWRFRVTMHPINGLVLHQVRYDDGRGEVRSILHRAALSDMVVPYGDTNPMHVWKHVLDAGEASIGNCANSLKLGCDCLGEIHYLDHVAVKPDGSPRLVEQAICIHEEDYGILWKHQDGHGQTTEVRRSRRLVVSAFHTVGNYEYGFYWYLYLDGRIQMEAKLTGIVGVSAVADGETRPEYAPLIAPNLASPIHQHLFCFRLDCEIDGATNSVYEVDTVPAPVGDDNPDGTAFFAESRLLGTELAARRHVDASRSRFWKIVNPERRNRLGVPVGYRLVPEGTPALLAAPGSQVAKRAGFAQYNLWVTPCEEDRLSAAGDHPNLGPGDGLPTWTEGDRDVEGRDIVVWHTFGSTHVPKPEDWPVMPVEYCGFTLQPVGFFDRNPALDLPATEHCEAATATDSPAK